VSDVHNFRTADGCLVQTSPAPDYLGEGHILTLSMTGKHDARRVSVHLRPDEIGQISDGYHTFNELYRFRTLYHAAFVTQLHLRYAEFVDDTFPGPSVKSWKHSDGEPCFGGGWFIVVTKLPTGQISNHYEAKHWDLFHIPDVEEAPMFDGHTPADVLDRLEQFLRHG
jgi:hypothetical protein